jgi:hypothetical protein
MAQVMPISAAWKGLRSANLFQRLVIARLKLREKVVFIEREMLRERDGHDLICLKVHNLPLASDQSDDPRMLFLIDETLNGLVQDIQASRIKAFGTGRSFRKLRPNGNRQQARENDDQSFHVWRASKRNPCGASRKISG